MGYWTGFLLDSEEDERVKCPKCGTFMQEQLQNDMTEGQFADYQAGFNIPFECPACGNYDLFDVDVFKEFNEFEFGDRINEKVIEDLIDRAIAKRCFIEVLSLVHNVVELYLKHRLKQYLFKSDGLDEQGLDPKRQKKKKNGQIVIDMSLDPTDSEKRVKSKFKNLFGSRNKYLHDYREWCYVLNLIDDVTNAKIIDFNDKRNIAIHRLFREDKSKGEDVKYSEIISAAKLGRRIQLELSPLMHTSPEIDQILKKFDISQKEAETDSFLSEN